MAFEIGQRVTNGFTGPGTVTGELFKDENRICYQHITFDNPTLGARDYKISKLALLEEAGDAA